MKRFFAWLLVALLMFSCAFALADETATEAEEVEEIAYPSFSLPSSNLKLPYDYYIVALNTVDGEKVFKLSWDFKDEATEFVVTIADKKTPDEKAEIYRGAETGLQLPAEDYMGKEWVITLTATLPDGETREAEAKYIRLKSQPWYEKIVSDYYLNFKTIPGWKYLWSGLQQTLIITLLSGCLGVVLGILIAAVRSTYDKTAETARKSWSRWWFGRLNDLCRAYLTVIRGTPVVVQLMIIYFVIFATSDQSTLVAALAFGLNSAAYVAEIVRGGIMSIDNGQFEAGRSLGFNYVQTMWYIVIPQMIKNVLPALVNEFIALLKETSVAGYVAVQDLTKGGDIIRSRTYSAFMPLIAVALIYLVLVMFFSYLVSLLEKRLRKSEH